MKYESLFEPPVTKAIKSGRVRLSANEQVGEHITEKKEEMIIVLEGVATLNIEGNYIELKVGETYYIREGKKHNVLNNTEEDLEYIYVVSMHN